MLVEDQHPLKQGLKLEMVCSGRLITLSRRPTSTKTRIETIALIVMPEKVQSRRPTSTKTRIETSVRRGHTNYDTASKTNIH